MSWLGAVLVGGKLVGEAIEASGDLGDMWAPYI
jgi:hypothetical protein